MSEASYQERVWGMRQAMLDALRWTKPGELSEDGFPALAAGIELLGQTTFSEADEEAWLKRLLEAGWNLVPAADDPAILGLRRRLLG